MNTQELMKDLQQKYPKIKFDLCPFSDLALDGVYSDEELKAKNLPEQFITFEYQGIGVWDPYASECSRFVINPEEEYNLKKEDAKRIVQHNKIRIHEEAIYE